MPDLSIILENITWTKGILTKEILQREHSIQFLKFIINKKKKMRTNMENCSVLGTYSSIMKE